MFAYQTLWTCSPRGWTLAPGDDPVLGHLSGTKLAIEVLVNPDKLGHLGRVSELALKPPPETR